MQEREQNKEFVTKKFSRRIMPQTIERKAKDFNIPQEYILELSRLLPRLHFVVRLRHQSI